MNVKSTWTLIAAFERTKRTPTSIYFTVRLVAVDVLKMDGWMNQKVCWVPKFTLMKFVADRWIFSRLHILNHSCYNCNCVDGRATQRILGFMFIICVTSMWRDIFAVPKVRHMDRYCKYFWHEYFDAAKVRYVCKHGTFSFVGCFICKFWRTWVWKWWIKLKNIFINGSIGQNIYWW